MPARSRSDADDKTFTAILRLDTPREREYVKHGGILPVRRAGRLRAERYAPAQPSEMRARYGLVLRRERRRSDETWPSCSQVMRLTTSSWPPNCSVTATMREVVRHLEVVEARAAVGAEALVAAEPGGERGAQRVALAAVLAVELLADLELARVPVPAATCVVVEPRAASAQPTATAASTAAIGSRTAMRRRRVNPNTR